MKLLVLAAAAFAAATMFSPASAQNSGVPSSSVAGNVFGNKYGQRCLVSANSITCTNSNRNQLTCHQDRCDVQAVGIDLNAKPARGLDPSVTVNFPGGWHCFVTEGMGIGCSTVAGSGGLDSERAWAQNPGEPYKTAH